MSIASILVTTCFVGLLWFPAICSSANILFFFGISSYSHRISAWPVVEKLASRGHNVTFFSPYPPKNPNPLVHEFCPQALKDWIVSLDEVPMLFNWRAEGKVAEGFFHLPEYGQGMSDVLLNDTETLVWVKNSQYDLVIIDTLFNDMGLGLAAKWNAKTIYFGTTSVFPWLLEPWGLPVEASWIPDMIYAFPEDLTFAQQIVGTLMPLYWNWKRPYGSFPVLDKLLRDKLEFPEMPSLTELEKNVSLLMINSHFSEEYPRALPPFVVPVGGMHCNEISNPEDSLPKDLKAFLGKTEHSTRGFVYISFGSYAEISGAPTEIKEAFFTTLRKMKHLQFVWKWNAPIPDDVPENVYLSKWMPQQALLANPRILAFISHSGLLGIQESIYHAVPIIAMPIFAEQDYNAERVHNRGYGIRLEVTTLKAAQLEGAIKEITEKGKFKENMVKVSKRFKDRPQHPTDTAVWWTEYVLRHDDAHSFLVGKSSQQTWIVRRSLHVWSFIAMMSFVILFGIWKLLKLLICCSNSNSSIKKCENKPSNNKKDQ